MSIIQQASIDPESQANQQVPHVTGEGIGAARGVIGIPQAPPHLPDYSALLERIAKEIAAGFDQLCQVLDHLSKRETQGRG